MSLKITAISQLYHKTFATAIQPNQQPYYFDWQSVAFEENFHGGVSFSGIWWSLVFGVRCLWRHNL